MPLYYVVFGQGVTRLSAPTLPLLARTPKVIERQICWSTVPTDKQAPSVPISATVVAKTSPTLRQTKEGAWRRYQYRKHAADDHSLACDTHDC
mmetsp:Transcript_25073/g.53252  ORF Transcript_25073/g.53252 Transcript_25073/m.53252 type:complete len:93 (-) Transcript_25073:410-688(-)